MKTANPADLTHPEKFHIFKRRGSMPQPIPQIGAVFRLPEYWVMRGGELVCFEVCARNIVLDGRNWKTWVK